MAEVVENTTAEEESTFHNYTGNAIPWYVRGHLDHVLVLRDRLRGDLAAAGLAVRALDPAMTTPLTRRIGLRVLQAALAGLVGQSSACGQTIQATRCTAAWDAGWRPRSSRKKASMACPGRCSPGWACRSSSR